MENLSEAAPLSRSQPHTLDSSAKLLEQSQLLQPASFVDGGILMREARVLGPGLVSGLKEGVGKSFADLHEFEKNLWQDPGATLSKFVGDHWGQAAVGAAITFLSPRKWANALFLATSMRGVVRATGEAAVMAAATEEDAGALSAQYAANISEETRGFVNSLPMGVAGGMFGRLGANAMFGKNMGLWDVATKDVKLSDVRANLTNVREQLFPSQVKVAVFDLDNTLVPTRKYLALGIEDGITQVSKNTGVAESELYSMIGKQMELSKAHTYPWTLELALADRFAVGKEGGWSMAEFQSRVTEPFWKAMDESLVKNLKTYDGVESTLTALQDKKIPIVVLSNSTASSGLRRFIGGGLAEQGMVERLYTLPNYKPPTGLAADLLASGQMRMDAIMEQRLPYQRILPPSAEKPSTKGMEAILRQYKVRPQEILFVGDNLRKDMAMAEKTGVRGFRAAYSDVDKQFGYVLDRLEEGKTRKVSSDPLPKYEGDLAQFSDVLSKLQKTRDYGALAGSLLVAPRWYQPLQTYGLAPGGDFKN